MPLYEYEPDGRECFICLGRTEVLQAAGADALKYCPTCGLEVRRVISRASFKIGSTSTPDRAADRGFTTFKRVEKGKWEKVAGEGPDMIVGTQGDMEAVEAESVPRKVINLDSNES